jgi:hypothetical protein
VEATQETASTEIKRARELLASLVSKQKSQATFMPKTKARSSSERILSLGGQYFGQPREALEVEKALAQSGFHYKTVVIRKELLRMVKRGQLRRVGEGTKSSPYKYVNP